MEQISGEIEYEMMILHFDSRSHFRAIACCLREELGGEEEEDEEKRTTIRPSEE